MDTPLNLPHGFDLVRYLGHLPLFQALDPGELGQLACGCTMRRFSRGQLVFAQGEPCEHFFVVVTGQVKLFVSTPNGQEKVIEILQAGHSFAEALMFMGKPYILSAQALADALVLSVPRATVLERIGQDPRFALKMLAGMSQRLHRLIKDVEGYCLHSGVQRVIGYLLSLAQSEGDEPPTAPTTVTLQVSKATIASRLSLTPEYFSRVLHELEGAGLIRVDKRDIHIGDPQRLAAYEGR